jgi:hypothetical protein
MMKSAHVWERKRNAAKARIKWMFTTDKVRAKMGRAASLIDCRAMRRK